MDVRPRPAIRNGHFTLLIMEIGLSGSTQAGVAQVLSSGLVVEFVLQILRYFCIPAAMTINKIKSC